MPISAAVRKPLSHSLAAWLSALDHDGARCRGRTHIRADEEYREGYNPTFENLTIKLPFKEVGIDKAGVLEILEGSGLGLPKYYAWRKGTTQ